MPLGSTRQNFQEVVNQRDRAFELIREQAEEIEDLKARLQRAQVAPEASGDASLGEYLRLRYAGRFGSPETFMQAVDRAMGGSPILEPVMPYAPAAMASMASPLGGDRV